jgi:hypothetical protein
MKDNERQMSVIKKDSFFLICRDGKPLAAKAISISKEECDVSTKETRYVYLEGENKGAKCTANFDPTQLVSVYDSESEALEASKKGFE